MTDKPAIGAIEWRDLTIEHAEAVSEFYAAVVGWTRDPVSMDDYSDYSMVTPAGETVAGVCHARGPNADMPPQWLMYVRVANVEDSAASCERLGGKVLVAPKDMGGSRFCVIEDPAGAVLGLIADIEADA